MLESSKITWQNIQLSSLCFSLWWHVCLNSHFGHWSLLSSPCAFIFKRSEQLSRQSLDHKLGCLRPQLTAAGGQAPCWCMAPHVWEPGFAGWHCSLCQCPSRAQGVPWHQDGWAHIRPGSLGSSCPLSPATTAQHWEAAQPPPAGWGACWSLFFCRDPVHEVSWPMYAAGTTSPRAAAGCPAEGKLTVFINTTHKTSHCHSLAPHNFCQKNKPDHWGEKKVKSFVLIGTNYKIHDCYLTCWWLWVFWQCSLLYFLNVSLWTNFLEGWGLIQGVWDLV